MKRLLLFTTLALSLFASNAPYLSTLENDPSTFVAGCVNAITGQVVISESDLTINAAEPLVLPRSYTSLSAPKNHWEFYPHLRLELYKKFSQGKHKNHYLKVRDRSGVLYRYKQPEKGSPFHLDLARQADALVNTASGKIGGGTNIRNSYVKRHKSIKTATLHLGDGSIRSYKKRSLPALGINKKECLVEIYYLEKEHLSSGNVIRYEYDDQNRLKYIATESPQGLIYAEAKVHYPPDLLPGNPTCRIETSDERSIHYHYRFVQKQTLERSYYLLETVDATHLAKESFQYAYRGPLTCITSEKNRLLGFCYLISDSNQKPLKVEKILEPVGKGFTPEATYSFSYDPEKNRTVVKDACQEETTYHYLQEQKPCKIERGPREDLIVWDQDHLVGRKVLSEGEVIYEEHLHYDNAHNVIEKTLQGPNDQSTTFYEYDNINRLIFQKTPSGEIIRWTYFKKTNLPLTKKVEGLLEETYTYNKDHQLIEKHHISGTTHRITRITPKKGLPAKAKELYVDENGLEHEMSSRCFFYNRQAQVLKEMVYDAKGQKRYTLNYEYDKRGHLKSKTNPLGHKIFYTHNPFGQCIKEVHEATGLIIERAYDPCNRLISLSENGQQTTYTYDKKHRKISQTDSFGQTTFFDYDIFDHLIFIIYPNGDTEKKKYDVRGQLLEEIDGEGHSTRYERNIFGAPIKTKHPNGGNVFQTYDPSGLLIEEVDLTSLTTKHQRDAHGRITKTELVRENCFLEEERYEYDGEHLVAKHLPGDLSYSYEYDGAGRQIAEIMVSKEGQRITRMDYDSCGNIAKQTISGSDTDPLTTLFQYDELGQVLKEKVIGGRTTFYSYDGHGHQDSIKTFVNGKASTQKNLYDPHGRLISTTDPLGNETKIIYKEIDHLTKITVEPNGRKTTAEFDAKGRLIAESITFNDHTLKSTQMTYDACDRPIYETTSDGCNNSTYAYQYDALGHVIKFTESGERITETEYNQAGQKVCVIKPDGTALYYSYDEKGRFKNLFSSDGTINNHYEYDALGRVIRINDLIREYDTHGNLIKEILPTGLILKHSWDLRGRKKFLQLPNGEKAIYSHDSTHLRHIDFKGYRHSYHFDEEGLLKAETNIFGTLFSHTYDQLLRHTGLKGPDHFEKLDLFDSVGNLILKTLDGHAYQYEYDALDQLISESAPQPNIYRYDGLHNRLQKNEENFGYDELGQLLSNTITYNANGQPTQIGQQSYKYDALDRLIEITDGEIRITHTYDGLDRRIAKHTYLHNALTKKTIYLYDDTSEIGSIENNQIVDLRILGLGHSSDIGAAIIIFTKDGPQAPIHSLNGNLIKLVSNTLNSQTEFTAFGEISNQQGPLSPWGYQSKRRDSETGFINFGMRYYVPKMGRFLTTDPFISASKPNLYAYVKNAPLTRIDAYGLSDEPLDSQAFQTNTANDLQANASLFSNVNDLSLSLFLPSWNQLHTTYRLLSIRKMNQSVKDFWFSPYLQGSIQAVGGLAEAMIGGGVALGSWGIGAPVGGLILTHGLDHFFTGLQTAFSGNPRDSATSQFLQKTGMPSQTANSIDGGLSIVGSVGGIAIIRAHQLAASLVFKLPVNSTISNERTLLNFTDTAGKHMYEIERRVPIRILDDVIKLPITVVTDPQKASNAMMHYGRIWKNGKLYNIEVLYDKATNTISHFQYTQKPIGSLNKVSK